MYEINYREIGQRIKEYRKKAHLTQENLAEKVGISTVHLSHIESGNAIFSLKVFIFISIALNVSTDYLIFGIRLLI